MLIASGPLTLTIPIADRAIPVDAAQIVSSLNIKKPRFDLI